MQQTLTWALVVATYQREKILLQSLKLAVEQTRKPSEVIVVDASENWESTRDKVLKEIAPAAPDIRWVYVPALQRSTTLQRNQGLDLSTADVLFFLDDDSLMYPDCAEAIMKIYEADTTQQVMGVQAAIVDSMPSEIALEDSSKPVGWKQNKWSPNITGILYFAWKHILLMNNELLCIPYHGDFPRHNLPESLTPLNVHRMKIFHGCRMTFRRDAIARERFEPLLLYYALNEDMDVSYRISRRGMLLESGDAKLHHFQSSSGRLSRYVVATLSSLNQAVCLQRYSNNRKRDQFRFYVLTSRRIVAELFKDGLSRRWTFPQLRGMLTALRYAPIIFSLSHEELAEWYPQFQKAFITMGKPPSCNGFLAIQTAGVQS